MTERNILVYSCMTVQHILVYRWMTEWDILVYSCTTIQHILVYSWMTEWDTLVYSCMTVQHILVYSWMREWDKVVYGWMIVWGVLGYPRCWWLVPSSRCPRWLSLVSTEHNSGESIASRHCNIITNSPFTFALISQFSTATTTTAIASIKKVSK